MPDLYHSISISKSSASEILCKIFKITQLTSLLTKEVLGDEQ
jgi:hypothetical protein